MTEKTNGPTGYVKTVLDRVNESDLTDTELCRRAGIANSTFVRIKSGKHSPTMSTLDAIEWALENREAEMKRAGERPA